MDDIGISLNCVFKKEHVPGLKISIDPSRNVSDLTEQPYPSGGFIN